MLDPAGCQYGFREVLIPYATYLQDKQGEIVTGPGPYHWTETKDLEYFETVPGLSVTAAQRADAAVERKIRRHYASFVEERFGPGQPGAAKDLLGCSSESFGGRLGALMEDLKKCMISYMEKNGLYWQS